MKILHILVSILSFIIISNAQVLTGTVYDAQGALIPKAKVKAVSEKGQIFEAESNEAGVYTLNLPAHLYNSGTLAKDLKAVIYEIIVEHSGFEKYSLKGFKFVLGFQNKMVLDIALDGANPEPCGYGGADCLPNLPEKVDAENSKISNTILEKTFEKSKSNYCGTIRDEFGAVIPSVGVEGKSSNGKNFKTSTNENGEFKVEVIDGIYNILIKAESYKKAVLKNQKLPLQQQNCVEIKLKSNVPPHQIT